MQSIPGSTLHNKSVKFNVLLQTIPSKSSTNLVLNSSKILSSRSEFLIEPKARSAESLSDVAPRRVSPSSLLFSASVTNSRLQT